MMIGMIMCYGIRMESHMELVMIHMIVITLGIDNLDI